MSGWGVIWWWATSAFRKYVIWWVGNGLLKIYRAVQLVQIFSNYVRMDKWMKVFQKVLAYPRNYITSLSLHFTSSKFGINSNFVEKHRTNQCIVVLLFWHSFLDFLHQKTIESFCVWVSKCWRHFTGDKCSWNTCFLVQALWASTNPWHVFLSITSSQAPSYAGPKLWLTDSLTHSLAHRSKV